MAYKKENSGKKGRVGRVIGDAMGGRIISTSFLGKHWGVILALLILGIIYITNRYKCIMTMENIKRLETELTVVKSERIRQKSEYSTKVREKALTERMRTLDLDLQLRDKPPYHISK